VSAASVEVERDAALDAVQEGLRSLFAAERRLRSRDQHRNDRGLSHAHMRALFAINQTDTTPGEIAKCAQLSPAGVTAMLDDLEADGIVVRRRDTEDRRRVLVALTDEGHAVLEQTRRRWRAHREQALVDVPEDDLVAAARVMSTLAAMLDTL
jgi:MarR family transcriptional regulator, organic hydroperoxide resistance regulator